MLLFPAVLLAMGFRGRSFKEAQANVSIVGSSDGFLMNQVLHLVYSALRSQEPETGKEAS